ncbi:MAG: STAS domain-containing protein [Gammaproteobacteria bacterium]|jgi:phospholipid transport system transporter-binding protein|nr:STAS domain-containing protein [Gammaproteobacteria bacterium]MDH3847290.1 STAS domain-containing protein [Gammaproteobacteria bacterium]MDH3864404.1 STAS domain-containing protein [Gammaproteobacteria bacterium]MDH3905130.1 STAS domain-containing protein [Gammaproteobacteria bacterium]MDH3909110.1 STAS domain-containing protein [Gammaproteobacteria bacterium]
MSKFELHDLGEGHFTLNGEMTFETAERILMASEEPFEQHTRIEVDLSGVTNADSAGLALLLEWITWANHTVREIRFLSMPERVLAIARTTEVEQLLKRGERWAGFIEAPGA